MENKMTCIKEFTNTQVIMLTDTTHHLYGVVNNRVYELEYMTGKPKQPVGSCLYLVENEQDALWIDNGEALLPVIRRERKRDRDLKRKAMERQTA